MVPSSPVILNSPGWRAAMPRDPVTTGLTWSQTSMEARHCETFYALPYAMDVFVPLFNLGQETAWSATTLTPSGVALKVFTIACQLAG